MDRRPWWAGATSQAVKVLASAADAALGQARGVTVLIYHRVGGASGLAVDLPEALFRAQMEELAAQNRVCSLDEGLRLVAGTGGLGDREPVVVTFDDGTADFADCALPVLVDLHVPVVVYVATDFVESSRPFPADGMPLTWPALRDALSTGLVTVGSHTHSHALLDRIPEAAVAPELDRSIGLIEDRLGVTPAHFAYPKAVLGSGPAQAAVRQRFASAALAGTRPNRVGATDPYRVSRSPIQASDGMRWFRRKATGGMALEDTLRRAFNRRRYAGATT